MTSHLFDDIKANGRFPYARHAASLPSTEERSRFARLVHTNAISAARASALFAGSVQ